MPEWPREQVDQVLLVGGLSRAPGVSRAVREIFGRVPSFAVNPDEGVAMGAAIETGIIHGDVKDLVLLDVTPHTLGIETKDGSFTPLIERNSTIPTRKSRVFTTVKDDQTRVEVHVLQGESDQAAYNKSLQNRAHRPPRSQRLRRQDMATGSPPTLASAGADAELVQEGPGPLGLVVPEDGQQLERAAVGWPSLVVEPHADRVGVAVRVNADHGGEDKGRPGRRSRRL